MQQVRLIAKEARGWQSPQSVELVGAEAGPTGPLPVRRYAKREAPRAARASEAIVREQYGL